LIKRLDQRVRGNGWARVGCPKPYRRYRLFGTT
jgi:hypothetical protein